MHPYQKTKSLAHDEPGLASPGWARHSLGHFALGRFVAYGGLAMTDALNYQHGIAIAVKSILLFDCLAIRLLHQFCAIFISRGAKSADKHKKRGCRKVEISQQTIYALKFIPRINE